jgi:hypothetical protein
VKPAKEKSYRVNAAKQKRKADKLKIRNQASKSDLTSPALR